MQVTRITGVSYSDKTHKNQVKKSTLNNDNLSFKNFNDALYKSFHKDIPTTHMLNRIFEDLYTELRKEPKLTIYDSMKTLEAHHDFQSGNYYFLYKEGIQDLLDKLCTPIAQVPYGLKDIVLRVKRNKRVPLIDRGYGDKRETVLYLKDKGKLGFFNNIFKSDKDRNDIRIVMQSPFNKFEIGLDENCWLKLYRREQYDWKEGSYNPTDLKSEKYGSSPGEVTVVC